MLLIRILLVFAVIVGVTRLKKPLWAALAGATLAAGLLFRLPAADLLAASIRGATARQTLSLLGVIYTLTVLQTLMERRAMLRQAEGAMTALLGDKRLSLAIVPTVIGLLSAPGAVLMSASVLEEGAEGQFDNTQLAFLSSWYRHVPESSLPTFTTVVLASTVSGVGVSTFLPMMLPFILILMAVPWVLYLRKLPKGAGKGPLKARLSALKPLVLGLWPIGLILVLILGCGLSTIRAALIATAALALLGRYGLRTDLIPAARSGWRPTMLASIFFLMLFKEVLGATGAVAALPALLAGLPLPQILTLAVVFFLGTMVSGPQAMASMLLPGAMAALPSPATMTLLLSVGHIANQFCPTHVCLTLAADRFGVGLGDIYKKTVPSAAICLLAAFGLYALWIGVL